MKKPEKEEKTEKKPKETAKIRKKLIGFMEDLAKKKNKLLASDDYAALKVLIFETLAYGIPIGLIASYFLSTNILGTILVSGLFMVLLDKKLLYIICQILSSINLVKVNN